MPLVNPLTVIGDDDALPVTLSGVEVATYVSAPPFPVLEGSVNVTVAEAFPAVAVPMIGVSGFAPPLAPITYASIYALKSPRTIHVSVLRLRHIQDEYCARSFKPGVPLTVTPAAPAIVV